MYSLELANNGNPEGATVLEASRRHMLIMDSLCEGDTRRAMIDEDLPPERLCWAHGPEGARYLLVDDKHTLAMAEPRWEGWVVSMWHEWYGVPEEDA